MKKLFYSMSSIVLVLSVLSMALPLTAAEEPKPVVTVSFAGYSELKADVEAVGKLSGRPELAQILEGMLEMVTQGKGLAGLDQKQPIGAVLLSNETGEFTTYGFLPVSNLDQLMEIMKNPMTGEALKANNGIYEISLGMENIYVTQRDNWAYVAQKKETLTSLPNDPAALLGDLPKKYLLAVRASLKNIPDAVRDKGLAAIQMLIQIQMQRMPDESDAQYGARTAMTKQNIEQIEKLSKELDEVMLGVTLDRQSNNFRLELELTAKPETNLAARLATAKPGKTDFAGLKIPGAALTANGTASITDDDVQRTKTSLDAIRVAALEQLKNQELAKEQLDVGTELLNELFDVAVKTVELKKSDYGISLILEPNAVTLVAGSIVADGAKIEDILKKLLAEAGKDDPDVAQLVKINVETYKGLSFSVFSMPTPDPKLVSLVGDTLDVVLGISDKKVFLAAGRDANKNLKEAIDRSQSEAGKESPSSQLVISGLRIAIFVSALADDEQLKAAADKMASALEQSGDKDHLSIVTEPITNGARVKLEIEEGLLKAIGEVGSSISMGP